MTSGQHLVVARPFLALACLVLALGLAGCDQGEAIPLDSGNVGPQSDVREGSDYKPVDPNQGKPECAGTFRIEDLDGNPVEEPEADIDWLFDRAALRTFDIEMDPADWEYLNKHALEEEYVPANLVFDGRRYVGIGVRYKGAWSSLENCVVDGVQVCPKLSLKLRFNKYDSCGRFHGLRRLVFNSGLADTTMMREPLMYGIYTNVGIDVPHSAHALLRVNGEPYSVYILIEPVDKEWIQARFEEDEGNLYKQPWPNTLEEWVYTEALRTNEEEGDISDIMAFAKAVLETPDADFEATVGQFTDLARLAQIMAVGRVIGDEDGITRFWCFNMFSPCLNHNFYWYNVPGGRFHLIPWDLDVTFYHAIGPEKFAPEWWDPSPYTCDPIPHDYFEDPDNYEPPANGEAEELVLPPQCDRLMERAMAMHTDSYNEMLAKLVPALEQAQVELESFKLKLTTPLMDDPKYELDLAQFENDTSWFMQLFQSQVEYLNDYLDTLP